MKNPLKTKLRIRFVVLSMAALLLLQGTIVAVSIYHNYGDMTAKSDVILRQLQQDPSANVRYFSVKVHPGKGTVRTDTVQHVSITPEQAGVYAKKALESGKDRGFIQDYRYHILRRDDGIKILFLSRSASIEMCRTASGNLILISALGLLAVCAILIPVSGWVVKPLLENYRKQKQFITMAGHELKTPLTVISTDAQLLRTEIGDNQWIDGILHQVEQMNRMTYDLVTLAKTEELDPSFIKEAFSLSQMLEEALEIHAGRLQQEEICCSNSIPDDVHYCGNADQIRQLIGILLDNACKYCPRGGKLKITLKRELRGVHLVMENTAAALTDADKASLTQRFYRGSNAAGKAGFGLGLSIAEAIALRHNGNLTVRLSGKDSFLVEVTLR